MVLHGCTGCLCSVMFPGSVAGDKGKQWSWLELVICTGLAAGAGHRHLYGGRVQLQTHMQWSGSESAVVSWATCKHMVSSGGPGCQHVLP